jgi:hypothetical protein
VTLGKVPPDVDRPNEGYSPGRTRIRTGWPYGMTGPAGTGRGDTE